MSSRSVRAGGASRLISDVPLGLFLSGGIDSSYVLAQMVAAGARAVQTFSIGFADSRYDERASRALGSRTRFGASTTRRWWSRRTWSDLLPQLVRHYGEPFADPSAVPTFYVARMARERITVA